MKAIPGNNAGPQWNNQLLDDLIFIKKYLRYRISKKTIPSALLIAIFLFFGARMMWMTVRLHQQGNSLVSWVIAALLIIIFIYGMLKYLRTLKFTNIPTPFFANENMKLVDTFLKEQQLNTYRHPKAPEVFQILSRPLGNNTEQREVMIFIADDKRILINSHFINQKWALSGGSRNSRQMANRLKEWITKYYTNTQLMTQ